MISRPAEYCGPPPIFAGVRFECDLEFPFYYWPFFCLAPLDLHRLPSHIDSRLKATTLRSMANRFKSSQERCTIREFRERIGASDSEWRKRWG